MRSSTFARFMAFREALLAAEEDHQDSPALALLHERANELMGRFSHLFSEEQYEALSGGGPNKPPPDDVGGG